MKKILCTVLCGLLVLSMLVVASAEGYTNTSGKERPSRALPTRRRTWA